MVYLRFFSPRFLISVFILGSCNFSSLSCVFSALVPVCFPSLTSPALPRSAHFSSPRVPDPNARVRRRSLTSRRCVSFLHAFTIHLRTLREITGLAQRTRCEGKAYWKNRGGGVKVSHGEGGIKNPLTDTWTFDWHHRLSPSRADDAHSYPWEILNCWHCFASARLREAAAPGDAFSIPAKINSWQ